MSATTKSLIHAGSAGALVDIECHISNSLPNIVIVGFASKTVDESKERLRGAFGNSHLQMPRKRISINLAPADLPKDSSSLDMAIAIAILYASRQVDKPQDEAAAYIGELGLDGTIRPVRGLIGKLLAGKQYGIQRFYIPAANLEQARLVPAVELIPVTTLRQLFLHLNAVEPLAVIDTRAGTDGLIKPAEKAFDHPTFDDVVGQELAKRALEIAAAGGHNLLLNGPPGTGKSMLAKAFTTLLPPLGHEEMLEVTHLHSLANRDYEQLVRYRPFRAPHHSASGVAILGGGTNVRPGEISLSHRGVLFLDELPEYPRFIIEALRQPLEDKTITIARAKDSVVYPADFIFLATANPCPCGYFGSSRPCLCGPAAIARYRHKLSGPLLDRIDMCVTVEAIDHSRLLAATATTARTAIVQAAVNKARQRQARRYGTAQLNGALTNRDIRSHAELAPEAKTLLDAAAVSLDLSARAYMRTVKVARTIADLAEETAITSSHIAEALQYRPQSVLAAASDV